MTGIPEAARDPVETRFAGPWLIPDRDYLSFVARLFAAAERRCLVSVFLVSAPWRDRELVMETLLVELADASARGVDARLLVGGAQSNTMMVQLAEAARQARAAARRPLPLDHQHSQGGGPFQGRDLRRQRAGRIAQMVGVRRRQQRR